MKNEQSENLLKQPLGHGLYKQNDRKALATILDLIYYKKQYEAFLYFKDLNNLCPNISI